MRFPKYAVIKEGETCEVSEDHVISKIIIYPKIHGEPAKLRLDDKIIFLTYVDIPFVPSVRITGAFTVEGGCAQLEYEEIEKDIECKHIYGFADGSDDGEGSTSFLIYVIREKFIAEGDTIFKYCPLCGIDLKPHEEDKK